MRKPTRGAVLYRHVTPVAVDVQRIGPMFTDRPYPSVEQRSASFVQRGPMSPRHEPTETRRPPKEIVAGSQSRSQLAGLGARCGQEFFFTRQEMNGGVGRRAVPPMQLMFPEGDWKWTSDDANARLRTAANTLRSYAS
jgi:hypothetical protein